MPSNEHKYLKNEPKTNEGFKKQRGRAPKEEKPEEAPLPKTISTTQKDKLRVSNALLFGERRQRRTEKTIEPQINIELVRIYFFTVFNLDLQKKFLQRYGLSAVEYTDYNKTVLFEITNEEQFKVFLEHIRQVVASAPDEPYEGKSYNLVALIFNYEFLTDRNRLGAISEKGFLISLVSSVQRDASIQRGRLFGWLREQGLIVHYEDSSPAIIEVPDLSRAQLSSLVKNFDIIRKVTSTRPVKIGPGQFGEQRRTYNFTVDVPDNLPVVGIIDTGVSAIPPLRDAITSIQYDHTGFGGLFDASGHGTMVAGLVVLGEDFLGQVKTRYTAKAKIAVLKVIHNNNDSIDIPGLLRDIRLAKQQHGIRLFNMSVNLAIIKPYNDSYSSFAYELDKLAYEEDILICMAIGNYPGEDLKKLLNENYHPSHDYPAFFYDLTSSSPYHSCWFTNIMEPSESLNHLSVGALAGNVESNKSHDSTPASEYPAYYTRKFHFDTTQAVNGTMLQKNQQNKFLNKPDLVFEGGDLFKELSGIEILTNPVSATTQLTERTCGTSLASPLVASYAAEIMHLYPDLNMQSVKALLLNNCFSAAGDSPAAFQNQPVKLYKKLTGFGKPGKNNLLLTDDNTVTWVIEENIDFDEVKVIPIKFPVYLANAGNKLHVEATLCYRFLAVKDNHLNYLPLHISFGFFKNMDAESIAFSDGPNYKIKNSITWSEDFHGIENRLFSNSQRVSFNLQPDDFSKLDNQISIAARCSGKTEVPESILQYLENTAHQFSIVITISEIPIAKASGNLYNQLNAVNITENIITLDGTANVDLGNN